MSLDPDTPDIFTGRLPAEMLRTSPTLDLANLDQLVSEVKQDNLVIDWARYLKLRPWVLQQDPELSYLLLPEMQLLIESAKTEQQRVLFATLWVTGGRISEVLALTPKSFIVDDAHLGSAVSLPTRKKRNKSGKPTLMYRLVPVIDPTYWQMVQRFLADHRGGANAPIFQSVGVGKKPTAVSVRTTQRWVDNCQQSLSETYQPGIKISPHTFRHSFAVNALLHGRDIRVISQWLGHDSVKETERYLNVLSLDTGHLMQGVRYWA